MIVTDELFILFQLQISEFQCAFFVTDVQGDPVKFQYNEELKHLVPVTNPGNYLARLFYFASDNV